MKRLVTVTAPADYIHKSRTVYINPDEVVMVGKKDGLTFIKLKTGDVVYSHHCESKVIADIEGAKP